MIDELGHEAALPSWLGTIRADGWEFGVDLAMAAAEGKSSPDLSFPPPGEPLRAARIRGCGLTAAPARNPSETKIKTRPEVRPISTSF
jgi:hypothetical protein